MIQVPQAELPHQDLAPKLAGKVHGNKTISLADAANEFKIPDLAQCFRQKLDAMWGREITESICGPLEDFVHTHIKVYQSVAFYYRPFQQQSKVEKVLLRCVDSWRASKESLIHNI